MIDRMLDVVFGKSKITKPMFIKGFSKENRQLDQLLEIESSVIETGYPLSRGRYTR